MTRSATISMTSNVIAPEDFLRLYRDIRDTRRGKDEATAAHKAAYQRAKAAGVDLSALKIVEHLQGYDDAEAELRMRETIRYAGWMGLEIGTQADMFGADNSGVDLTAQVVNQHRDWKAEQDGYEAGKKGEPPDNCPHSLASPLAQRWQQGHREGVEFRNMTRPPPPAEDA